MNIGFISTIGNLYSWAGSEEMWYGTAKAAVSRNHSVVVHAASKIANSSKVDDIKSTRVKIFPRPDFSPISRRLANRKVYSRYSQFFKCRLDIICISMGGIADCIWIPDLLNELYSSDIPYIVIVQANAEGIVSEEPHRKLLRNFYEKADTTIFVSKHNHRLAERQLGIKFRNMQIIPNPLRKRLSRPLPWPNENDGPLCFAEVARLEVIDKQQDHLLEALSTKQWKSRNWKLSFFGSGNDKEHINRLIHFYGLENKVSFGGFVNDFRDIWQDYHLHILPSRREGMPLALIESMACGRPAMVTHAGGSTELIDDGINGFVCDGMHPEVLRDSLERAWQQRHDWCHMGKNAASKVKSVQLDNWAEKILSLLQSTAESPH